VLGPPFDDTCWIWVVQARPYRHIWAARSLGDARCRVVLRAAIDLRQPSGFPRRGGSHVGANPQRGRRPRPRALSGVKADSRQPGEALPGCTFGGLVLVLHGLQPLSSLETHLLAICFDPFAVVAPDAPVVEASAVRVATVLVRVVARGRGERRDR
jgi:hypothetical protein